MLTGYDDFIAELSRQTLLEELQDKLPTERKIEHGLNMITKKKWKYQVPVPMIPG